MPSTPSPSAQFSKLERLLLERRRSGTDFDVAAARRNMESAALPVADDISVTPTEVAGLPAEWIEAPEADAERVIVYIHGGGFVMGSLVTHRKLAGDIARASASRVLLLDYPLAPESPFPAAIDSILAAYEQVRVDLPTARVAMAGDSAGGNLVVAAMLALRDHGRSLPQAAVCISPWADLARPEGVSADLVERDPIVTVSDLAIMRSHYLGDTDPTNPRATTSDADLTGLPPLLIHVGEAEILVDDSRRLAARATQCGVDVTLEVWPHMFHVWHAFAGRVPESTEAVERVGTFIREHLTRSTQEALS